MSDSRSTQKWHLLGDISAFVIIVAGVTSPFHGRGDWEVNPPVLLIAAAMGAVLFFRRKTPRTVLALTVALTILLMIAGVTGPVLELPIAIAIYAIALQLPRRTAWLLSLGSALVLLLAYIFATPVDLYNPSWIALLAVPSFAAVAGSYSRSRRELLRATEERALAAEESRETEARRQVAEERLRIARDLHDVVAHQIAAINLHAELAESALDKNPDVAHSSLSAIKSSARQGLHDISSFMKLLRESTQTYPRLSLHNLPELVTRFERSGLSISLDTWGELSDLPELIDTAAFLVIQEGLTNASKYSADGRISVSITRTPQTMSITLQNKTALDLAPSELGGFGLIGMSERVSGLGGTVNFQVISENIFELAVVLPVKEGKSL